jgi:hypothetical protein
MNELDRKRKELELMRVELGKQELEFKIEERLDEVRRLREHIETQNKTIDKIKQELGK